MARHLNEGHLGSPRHPQPPRCQLSISPPCQLSASTHLVDECVRVVVAFELVKRKVGVPSHAHAHAAAQPHAAAARLAAQAALLLVAQIKEVAARAAYLPVVAAA